MRNKVSIDAIKAIKEDAGISFCPKREGKGKRSLRFFSGLGVIVAIFLISGSAQSATLGVCLSNEEDLHPCDYEDIPSAIEAASPGDVIEIESGDYGKDVVLSKEVTLKGVNSGSGLPYIHGIIYLCGHNQSLVKTILYDQMKPGFPELKRKA